MTPEARTDAIAFALATISARPGIPQQALRALVAEHLGGDTPAWTDATMITLADEVAPVLRQSHRDNAVQVAFEDDKQGFRNSVMTQENPWITAGDPLRVAALAQWMRLIAITAGGTGAEICSEEPINFVWAQRLADHGKDLLSKWGQGDTPEARAAIIARVDGYDKTKAALAFDCLDAEIAARAAGTYQTPEEHQRAVDVDKFNVDNA